MAGPATAQVIERFGDAPDDAFVGGRSATYLRETGQERDLAFVLEHVDDLEAVFVMDAGEVRRDPGELTGGAISGAGAARNSRRLTQWRPQGEERRGDRRGQTRQPPARRGTNAPRHRA